MLSWLYDIMMIVVHEVIVPSHNAASKLVLAPFRASGKQKYCHLDSFDLVD
jgi:hypothetical protein